MTPHVAPHVIFSHGKDSEPWGRKILALAETARAAGCSVDSVDYRGIDEVERRLEKLLITGREGKPAPVLVGSSLGAWLSLAAAERLAARALFLMAPAVGLEPLLPPLPILPAIEALLKQGVRESTTLAETKELLALVARGAPGT